MNKYFAYGLVFDSDLDLAPLQPLTDENPAQVRLRIGTVSGLGIDKPRQSWPFAQAGDSEIWLDIPEICRLLISGGDQILVDPYDGADEQSVRLFVLGSAMGAILHQRGFLAVHANAIRIGDGTLLIAGVSGAGKSTTAAVLHQMGFEVLSDDVVAIDSSGCFAGGFPQIKLWQDALEQLNISTEGLNRIRLEVEKFSFPLPSDFQGSQLPVRAIYFLEVADKPDLPGFELEQLNGIRKFENLSTHTYRRLFMEGLGLKPRHLQLCSDIAGKTYMARLVRPKGRFNAPELARFVLEDLHKQGLIHSQPERAGS